MSAEIIPFQSDLFETTREAYLRMQIERIELLCMKTAASADKVRKGAYANINQLTRQIEELGQRLESIERGICGRDQGNQEI